MAMNRPIWSPSLAGTFVRIPIGLYFVLTGLVKLKDISTFIATVKALGILPDQAATLFAGLLPYIEIVMGSFLVVGVWTTLAAVVTSFLLIAFILALGLFPYSSAEGQIYNIFNKDLILLGGTLSLLSSGAGAFSIDGFRQSG